MTVGVADVYSALYDGPADEEQDFVRWVAQTYVDHRAPRILDMGCGTGRLLPGLSEPGLEVVGYEPNPEYAEVARRTARDLPGVEVVTGGFLDLAEQRAFDVIFAINDPFAYLTKSADRREAVRRVREALRENGLFVIDNPNFIWILANYRPPQESDIEVLGHPAHHEPRHELDPHDAVFRHVDRVAIRDGSEHVIEEEHTFAITTFPELRALLNDEGFKIEALLASISDRKPVDRLDGPRMVITKGRRLVAPGSPARAGDYPVRGNGTSPAANRARQNRYSVERDAPTIEGWTQFMWSAPLPF